jgi:meckelin
MLLIGLVHALQLGTFDYKTINCTSKGLYDPTKILNGCDACPFAQLSLEGQTCSCVPGITSATCSSALSISPTQSLNQTLSFDRTFVVSCPSTQITAENRNICACNTNEYFLDRNQVSGLPLEVGQCVPCPIFSYPTADLSRCISCPDPVNMISTFSNGVYLCRCKSGVFSPEPEGGSCIPAQDLASAISRHGANTADIKIKGVAFKPEIFKTHYKYAITRCDIWGDLQACQLLANMCVMTFYQSEHATCKAYVQIAAQPIRSGNMPFPVDGQPRGIPWLYYSPKEQSSSVRNRNFSRIIKVGKTAPRLPFVLGVYNATGGFIGFQNVTNQLQLCPKPIEFEDTWNKPGNIFLNTCNVTLTAATFENHKTMFYELFMVEDDDRYHPVPVRIKNIISFGARPNIELFPSDSSQFNRRFTMVDTYTGMESDTLRFIRFPTTMKFWFRLTEETGKIRIPVLDIEYTEYEIRDIQSTPTTAMISFSTDYLQDYSGMGNAIMIVFVIFASFGVIHGFFKTRSWYLRNKGSSDVIDIFVLLAYVVFDTTLLKYLRCPSSADIPIFGGNFMVLLDLLQNSRNLIYDCPIF